MFSASVCGALCPAQSQSLSEPNTGEKQAATETASRLPHACLVDAASSASREQARGQPMRRSLPPAMHGRPAGGEKTDEEGRGAPTLRAGAWRLMGRGAQRCSRGTQESSRAGSTVSTGVGHRARMRILSRPQRHVTQRHQQAAGEAGNATGASSSAGAGNSDPSEAPQQERSGMTSTHTAEREGEWRRELGVASRSRHGVEGRASATAESAQSTPARHSGR